MQRLEAAVRGGRDEADEAVKGMELQCANCRTGRTIKVECFMDPYLSNLTVTPVDNMDPVALPPSLARFDLKCVSAIVKSEEILRNCPDFYAHDDVSNFVALDEVALEVDLSSETKYLFSRFDNSLLTDKFYTCLKILRMSAELHARRPASADVNTRTRTRSGGECSVM
mmetsp:Transcript_20572/g.50102  ORF Transcript_20572/g.50102 Transcript_20572/m.50102 type:complete len:169 (-) Transcript_20572:296-802(-)